MKRSYTDQTIIIKIKGAKSTIEKESYRGMAIGAIRNGETVAQLRDRLRGLKLPDYTSWTIKTAVDQGLIRLKSAKAATARTSSVRTTAASKEGDQAAA